MLSTRYMNIDDNPTDVVHVIPSSTSRHPEKG